MNKILIADASESDRRMMSVLLVKSGYEPIVVETLEAAKDEVEKLPPGAVIVTAMKFTRGTAQDLIKYCRRTVISYLAVFRKCCKFAVNSE